MRIVLWLHLTPSSEGAGSELDSHKIELTVMAAWVIHVLLLCVYHAGVYETCREAGR